MAGVDPRQVEDVVDQRQQGLGGVDHRVVADGLTPEQAADEAIARVKQLLGE